MNTFEERREKAQALMAEMGVAALQVTSRENYYYLTGDIRNVARLFLPQQGEPTIIVFDEEAEAARTASGISDVRGWRTPGQLMQTFFQLVKDQNVAHKKVGFCSHSIPGFLVYKFLRSNLSFLYDISDSSIKDDDLILVHSYILAQIWTGFWYGGNVRRTYCLGHLIPAHSFFVCNAN